MTKKKTQRIRLQIDGSPLKLDAEILEISHDGRRIKVRFDGPMEDTLLFAWNGSIMLDKELDKETDSPSTYSGIRLFRVV